MNSKITQRRILLQDLGSEPFRIFFPAAILAGIVGALLWPIYLWGLIGFYPGQLHARIMADGFFGGFIFGFLGTAMPRMLSASPFRLWEVLPLVVIHAGMVAAFASGKGIVGDILFFLLLIGFLRCVVSRIPQRKDLPPPGFVLVALAFLCVATGALLSVVQSFQEMSAFWIALQRLLSYQGFVLLPILGIGPFIFPRLLGVPNPHDFPESRRPPPAWTRKALYALAVGIFIIVSFVLEALGWHQTAYAVRFAVTLIYLISEVSFQQVLKRRYVLALSIPVALLSLVAGFGGIALFPGYRTSLLHLTLIGGFAVITLAVATRVIFGHSGNGRLLQNPNRWLIVSIGLILLGMATRMSSDFFPKVFESHFIYGAFLWIAGVLLWSVYVLPKVLIVDTEK